MGVVDEWMVLWLWLYSLTKMAGSLGSDNGLEGGVDVVWELNWRNGGPTKRRLCQAPAGYSCVGCQLRFGCELRGFVSSVTRRASF